MAFWSRQLTPAQRKWSPREQETYAIVSSLRKFAGYIGVQRVDVVTDHEALVSWWKEHVDTPSGPAGRRGRWHELLSRFNLGVKYSPGRTNVGADCMSRWAYPASKAYQDCSKHGSAQDAADVEAMEKEEEEERWRDVAVVELSRAPLSGPTAPGAAVDIEDIVVDLIDKPPVRAEALGECSPCEPPVCAKAVGVNACGTETGVAAISSTDVVAKASGSVMMEDWKKAYALCKSWGKLWASCHQNGAQWPSGVQLRGVNKQFMYKDGKLCVPDTLLSKLVHQWHEILGHCGVEKMIRDMKSRFLTPNLAECVKKVKGGCQVCQASERPNWGGVGWRSTPVPEHPMMDIALDVVHMGEDKTFDGKTVDSCLVVVDRHSGWIQAYPVSKKGLTAKQAALLLHQNWFCPFGVPRSVTSDLGSQFKASWWKTFCSLQGVLHAQAVSYHPRSNGRAERACGQLLEILRKLHQEKKCSWAEALPRALSVLHGAPGPGGVSPYASLFGRERISGVLELPEAQMCEDSVEFIARMQQVDRDLKETLDRLHKEAEKECGSIPSYAPGQKVWVLRPRTKGVDKMKSWWSGPCEVKEKLGSHTYKVQVSPTLARECHCDQLRPYFDDILGRSWPMFYTGSVDQEKDDFGVEDFKVEKIVAHRTKKNGTLEFLVKWEGYGPEENTWECAEAFLPQFCQPWATYCKKKKLHLDIVQHLQGS